MFGFRIEQIIFIFFFFSVSSWVGESIMETVLRGRFVNKGFFKGPYIPVYGIGGIAVYGLCTPLKPYPVLVFLVGIAACTLIEYVAAIILEKFLFTRGWDYDAYPWSKWCNYKKRIALTTSLFFGLLVLAILYFYWDLGVWLTNAAGPVLLVVIDIVLVAIFVLDATFTGIKCIRNKLAGIPNKTVGLE